MSTAPALPPSLLRAISSDGGGRVVLVLGAGCSNESPTSLPLCGDLSEQCHRRLVDDGILQEGDVGDKRDLSAVAKAVVDKTESQGALVERFPPDAFRNAEPNEGYLIMAALFLEGALSNTLTLNFDSAARTALGRLGAGSRVSIIRRPEDHRELGTHNLIYLHRDIDSAPDEIILRKEELELAWQDHWEEVIAQRVLSGPVTVFVGLGTPASVLIATTRRIVDTLGTREASVYVVDPTAYAESAFAVELEVPPKDYICVGWNELMRALAQRVIKEHVSMIARDCEELAGDSDHESEDVAGLCHRLGELGLIRLGHLRAAWMLEEGSYLPHASGIQLRLFSSLVLGVRLVERLSDRQANFAEEGVVEFTQDNQVARVMVCSGGGWMSYARVETELQQRQELLRRQGKLSSVALVGGVESNVEMATPSNIVAPTDPDDLISGAEHLRIVSISQLRADASLAQLVVR